MGTLMNALDGTFVRAGIEHLLALLVAVGLGHSTLDLTALLGERHLCVLLSLESQSDVNRSLSHEVANHELHDHLDCGLV